MPEPSTPSSNIPICPWGARCISDAGCMPNACARSAFHHEPSYPTGAPLVYQDHNFSEPVAPSIQSTLAERGVRYGDFTGHAEIAEHLIQIMMTETNASLRAGWTRCSPVQRQALRAIADKIARILNGDPNYDDNWRDISGYATLVLERLPK